jgi:hypothetical protein
MGNKVRAGWLNVRYNESLAMFEPVLQLLKDLRKLAKKSWARGEPVLYRPWRVSRMEFVNDVGRSAARRPFKANTVTATFYMMDSNQVGCTLGELNVGQGFAYDASLDLQTDAEIENAPEEMRKLYMRLDETPSGKIRAMSFEDGGIVELEKRMPVEPVTLSILAGSWL